MVARHEVNLCCVSELDAHQHGPVASRDVLAATALAEVAQLSGVAVYGFRLTTWDDEVDPHNPLAFSPMHFFGLTPKTEAELRASPDPAERAQADSAKSDGMRRIVISPSVTLCVRDTAVFLPPLPDISARVP